jgi:predicted ATPase
VLVGRDGSVASVAQLLGSSRLVSLVGPGGVGKSQLAMAVARNQPDDPVVVDLGQSVDGATMIGAVADALQRDDGINVASTGDICRILRPSRRLLVLDNCEHVAANAALLVDSILRTAPGIRILVTSTEPLRTDGEIVFRVPLLDVPAAPGDRIEGAAMALFVGRLRGAHPWFQADAASVPLIWQICQRLDGLPLGIEIAAGCAATLSLKVVASCLERGFDLPAGGRRSSPARQQTLRTRFDWSYGLLTAPQRIVLRRLSVFRGSFELDTAVAAVADDGIGPRLVENCMAELVMKSLISTEPRHSAMTCRLLAVDRAYARQKLECDGGSDAVWIRCARRFRDDAAAAFPGAGLVRRLPEGGPPRPDHVHPGCVAGASAAAAQHFGTRRAGGDVPAVQFGKSQERVKDAQPMMR